jgi:hypothetical protein
LAEGTSNVVPGFPKWPNTVVFSVPLYYLKKEAEAASKIYGLKS